MCMYEYVNVCVHKMYTNICMKIIKSFNTNTHGGSHSERGKEKQRKRRNEEEQATSVAYHNSFCLLLHII